MKVVPKILNLERKETKNLVTIRKKERKMIVSPGKKKIWRKKGMRILLAALSFKKI